MKIAYRNGNPEGRNESLLLAFEDALDAHTPCLLVDAGGGVDPDELLDDDEYLAAVLLTHAHLDHYQSLGDVLRDGAPVLASPATARVLEDVLGEGQRHYDLSRTAAVLDALEPVDDWRTVVDGLRVTPVPAGHAPGAAGFRIAVDDGPETRSLLVTGDFTPRRAAGYPGLDPAAYADVDVLVLTGATDDRFEEQFTHAVGRSVARARDGSTVLLTASGLQGTHLGYVLGHLMDDYGLRSEVTLAGHVARLYDDLEYDVPGVTAVPTFADPDEVLAPGTITIAGPEVPVDGSAKRLFGAIADDPGATLVQATSGGTDPVETADCTVDAYDLRNHPTEQVVDGVVEAVDPLQVVVTHQRGRGLDRYKDKYASFVWATADEERHRLYDGTFVAPPWMTDDGVRRVRSAHYGSNGVTVSGDAVEVPALDRKAEPELAREGLQFDVLVEEYRLNEPGSPGSGESEDPGRSPDQSEDPGASNESSGLAEPGAGRADADPESDASGAQSGPPPELSERVEAMEERLSRVESAVAGRRVRARVVDAGDGVRLLRLLGSEELVETLDHGEEVVVAVRTDDE